jgi:hypothetical protein
MDLQVLGVKGISDTFEIACFYRSLRVMVIRDMLNGIGYFDLCLMSAETPPIWTGRRF